MRGAAALVLAAVGLACGSSPASFGDDYEAALCEWATSCRVFEETKQCRESLLWEEFGRFGYMAEAIAAGRARFDEDAAARCFEAIEALPCTADELEAILFREGFAAAPPACQGVYVGTVGNYEPCMHSGECVGDAVCGFPPCDEACCEGSCRQLGGGAELGEPCAGSCEAGAYCARDPDTGSFTVCEARRDVGAACDESRVCEASLFCRFEGGSGRCEARGEAGAGCTSGESCAEGLMCYLLDFESEGRCRRPPELGDVCNPSLYPACEHVASYCDYESHTCQPLAEPGEPCGEQGCVPYARCDYSGVTPTCAPRGGLGDATSDCLGHLQWEGERCVEPEAPPRCEVPG